MGATSEFIVPLLYFIIISVTMILVVVLNTEFISCFIISTGHLSASVVHNSKFKVALLHFMVFFSTIILLQGLMLCLWWLCWCVLSHQASLRCLYNNPVGAFLFACTVISSRTPAAVSGKGLIVAFRLAAARSPQPAATQHANMTQAAAGTERCTLKAVCPLIWIWKCRLTYWYSPGGQTVVLIVHYGGFFFLIWFL